MSDTGSFVCLAIVCLGKLIGISLTDTVEGCC